MRPIVVSARNAESQFALDATSTTQIVDAQDRIATSIDNRTDELRLLGNGVVPQTAERAWRVLVEELINNKETR
jgi:hypothetical protein